MTRPTAVFRTPADATEALEHFAHAFGVGEESQAVAEYYLRAITHSGHAVFRQSLADKFAGLAATWHEETEFTSSLRDMVLHPAYQRIIGLGPEVVPLVLQELAERPDHWFAALYALTGVNPVDRSIAGSVPAMTEAWLRWGREQSYLD